jgi:hypothetical protein
MTVRRYFQSKARFRCSRTKKRNAVYHAEKIPSSSSWKCKGALNAKESTTNLGPGHSDGTKYSDALESSGGLRTIENKPTMPRPRQAKGRPHVDTGHIIYHIWKVAQDGA